MPNFIEFNHLTNIIINKSKVSTLVEVCFGFISELQLSWDGSYKTKARNSCWNYKTKTLIQGGLVSWFCWQLRTCVVNSQERVLNQSFDV